MYFCGHGITGNGIEHYLLLEDHGADARRPFQTGSFDITNTLRALCRQVPAQLYVFVDACRTFERRLALKMGALPDPLLEESPSTENVNLGTTQIQASSEGMPAYGDSNNVSRFMEALLRALNKYSGVPQAGTDIWLINGQALCQTMPKLVTWVSKERRGAIQSCTPQPSGSHDFPLHIRTEPPMVNVEIEVTPEMFRTRGEFRMHDLVRTTLPPLTGGGTAGVWQTDAQRGTYRIKVLSRDGAFQQFDSGLQYVDPPTYYLPIELRP